MAEFVFQFYMLLVMILWAMKQVLRDGVLSSLLRKYCCLLLVCLQVNVILQYWEFLADVWLILLVVPRLKWN